jgi:hypothetical protein
MRILVTVLAGVLLFASGASSQSSLLGTWRSAPDEIKLTSDFDRSVWGANATSTRTVELAVRSATEATLRVVKRVLDAKGRVVPASTWIEEAQLRIGAAAPGAADRVEHDITVTSAVRLFPDDPSYRWTIDGLKVRLVSFTGRDGNTIEVRYDTPEGRGSFWETLSRARATSPNSQRPTPSSQRQTPKPPAKPAGP